MPTVKVGNVIIPITRRADGRFWVRWRENGRPMRRPYKDLEKAKTTARLVATRLANNQPILSDFTAGDRDVYRHAEKVVGELGGSIIGAIEQWAQIRRAEVSGPRRTPLPDLVEQLIIEKKDHKLSARYMRGLCGDLRAFARRFVRPIADVQALEISNYLRGLGVGDRRRNNIRDEIVTLFLFAKEHGRLPNDKITEAEKVKRIGLEQGAPRIYTPAQLAVILEQVAPDWLDWICCQAFAGIRPEEAGCAHVSKRSGEIRKLMWSDFLWDEKQIRIVGAISKTGRDRYAELNETMLVWCGNHRGETGPVCKYDRPDRETERLGKVLGFPWINDGLRHSYASYWMSLHKNMAMLKELMGNSESVNRRYYYHPQPAALAKKWWITPSERVEGDSIRKIIQLPLGMAFA